MTLFDRHIVVDWSAASQPVTGANSIWVARRGCGGTATVNVPTRAAAMALLEREILEAVHARERLFVGLDFAFGYPARTKGLPRDGDWNGVWAWLYAQVEDRGDNANNRFEVAAEMNAGFGSTGPFWGLPPSHAGRYPQLTAFKPDYAALGIRERRHIDSRVPRAQPVWKLAYPGSVGSQTLTGIARLEALRRGACGSSIAIWPFETRFADDLEQPITIAEIYPSLYPIKRQAGVTLDQMQVETLADGFSARDREGGFRSFLDGPRSSTQVRDDACAYEGWMVGFADEVVPL